MKRRGICLISKGGLEMSVGRQSPPLSQLKKVAHEPQSIYMFTDQCFLTFAMTSQAEVCRLTIKNHCHKPSCKTLALETRLAWFCLWWPVPSAAGYSILQYASLKLATSWAYWPIPEQVLSQSWKVLFRPISDCHRILFAVQTLWMAALVNVFLFAVNNFSVMTLNKYNSAFSCKRKVVVEWRELLALFWAQLGWFRADVDWDSVMPVETLVVQHE